MGTRSGIESRLAVAVLVVLAFGSGAEARKLYSYRGGGWRGGAYSYTDSSRFSHCGVAGTYSSGVMLALTISREYELSIALSKGSWRLEKGRSYPVAIRIDDHRLGEFAAKVRQKDTLIINLGNSQSVLEAFRRGRDLRIEAARKNFRLSLAGTATALRKTRECVDTALALRRDAPRARTRRDRRVEINPFASVSRSPSNPGSGKPRTAFPPDILKTILAKAGMTDPVLFDPGKRLRKKGYVYQWREEGLSGLFLAAKRGSLARNRAYVETFLSSISSTCEGKFGYLSAGTSQIGPIAVKAGRGLCRENKRSFSTYVTALYGSGSAFLFTHVAKDEHIARGDAFADRLHGVILAIGKQLAEYK